MTIDGIGLVIGFIEHLYTQLLTTSNYSAVSDSHTLQFTTAHTKSSQSAVFTSHCLVATSSSGRSLTWGSWTIPVPQLPASNSNGSQWLNCSSPLTNWLLTSSIHCTLLRCTALTNWVITSKHGPHRNTIFLLLYLLLHVQLLAMGLHATIFSAVHALIVYSGIPNLYSLQFNALHFKWIPCHHGMVHPQVMDGGDGLQIWRVAANMLNKQSWAANKGWFSRLGGLGVEITSPHHKTWVCYEM
jgi:hypothetical protein